jgi:hypothetical protein
MGIAYRETGRIVKGKSKIYIGKRNYLLEYDFKTSGNLILSLNLLTE